METRTRGKGTIDHGLWGSVGTLDDMNSTRLSKWSQAVPLHLFNKKKFEKLPDKWERDHKINLTEEAPKELNAKAYPMMLKEEEILS